MSTLKNPFLGSIVDGLPWPADFPEENYHTLNRLPLKAGDVILSSYPKAGTTWMGYILWGIYHPHEDAPPGNQVYKDIRFVDLHGLPPLSHRPDRLICTHVPPDRLPNHPRAKFVVIVRNPFDLCVSYYYFMKALQGVETREDDEKVQEDFFEWFLKGEIAYGDFFSNVGGWYERRLDDNVFFVTYEDLKKNHKGEVLRLAKFLGREEPLEADGGKLLDKIVHHSSLSSMKKLIFTNPESTHPETPVPYVRKGVVGSFRNSLTPEQEARIRDKMEERLAGTELCERWGKI